MARKTRTTRSRKTPAARRKPATTKLPDTGQPFLETQLTVPAVRGRAGEGPRIQLDELTRRMRDLNLRPAVAREKLAAALSRIKPAAAVPVQGVRVAGHRCDGPDYFTAQNALFDAALPKGALLLEVPVSHRPSDDAIRILADRFESCGSPMSQILVEHFHGAASRVPMSATACAMRLSGYNVGIISQWTDTRQNDPCIGWCRGTFDALKPYFAETRYVNYLDHDEAADPAAAAYGANYSRLRELKAKYDSENIFHANVNIRPA